MENILEELYYGNIEVQLLKTYITPKLKDKFRKICEVEDQIRNVLSEDTLKLFDEYINKYNEYLSLSCCDSFMIGMKLGSRFMYDMFLD